jgi:hypothetical protein
MTLCNLPTNKDQLIQLDPLGGRLLWVNSLLYLGIFGVVEFSMKRRIFLHDQEHDSMEIGGRTAMSTSQQ